MTASTRENGDVSRATALTLCILAVYEVRRIGFHAGSTHVLAALPKTLHFSLQASKH